MTVLAEATGDRLRFGIRAGDDVGGAEFCRASRRAGIKDRVEARGGCVALQSEPFAGTSPELELPLTERVGASP